MLRSKLLRCRRTDVRKTFVGSLSDEVRTTDSGEEVMRFTNPILMALGRSPRAVPSVSRRPHQPKNDGLKGGKG